MPARASTTSLRILMIASEAQPFSKTGGLADVVGALPRALAHLGHDVTVVTPRYRGIDVGERRETLRVGVGPFGFDVGLVETPLEAGARVLFADCPPLFGRPGIYNEHNVDYADNALRFAILTLTALQWAATASPPVSLIHAHDWQAGLAPVYLRSRYASHPTLGGVPVIFTIHNIAYQGIVDKEWVPRLELGWERFTVAGFEFWDRLSLLKAGVSFADLVTTVSPTYAQEIQRPEYGYGFDGVMRANADRLVGILNGIDRTEWDPLADPHLPAPYSATDLSGKAEAKRALLDAFMLPTDEVALARPVVGMVSRMVEQKGLDLIEAAAARLMALDATFVIVGTGDARYQDMWRTLAARHRDRVGVFVGFDERRAHLVEGGADIFLMPSRFEPCGLNQMYSQRYGTVPVVRAVGGLVDTVRPFNPKNGQGTGFLFADYHPDAMLDALERALAARRRASTWERLQVRGMLKDFSWEHSAREYVKMYKRVIARRRPTRTSAPGAG
jgi:starch synthase